MNDRATAADLQLRKDLVMTSMFADKSGTSFACAVYI